MVGKEFYPPYISNIGTCSKSVKKREKIKKNHDLQHIFVMAQKSPQMKSLQIVLSKYWEISVPIKQFSLRRETAINYCII